jgi:hypothetical protein
MPEPVESRVILTLALDMTHWRRHDRGHWAQVLAGAANEAAPHIMHVEGYELSDTLMTLRMRSNRTPKTLRKLWRDDEVFMRLRARLADLGARTEFEVEEDKG